MSSSKGIELINCIIINETKMKKMMITGISLLAILALMFVMGLLLPNQREFVKTAEFSSSPKEVFETVTDIQAQTEWRSDLKDIHVLDDKTWKEVPKKGASISFRVKEKIEYQLFKIEIIEPKSFNGYWVGTFDPLPDKGTKVVFKEVVIIPNPFFRLLSFLFIDLDKTMELYLTDLKDRLGD